VTSLPFPSLHLITSRHRLMPAARTVAQEIAALEAMLDDAIEAGVDVVQVRERDLPAGVLVGLVSRVVTRAASTQTRVLVNERLDVAVAAGATGVHLPSHGFAASRVRDVGPEMTVGRSIHPGDAPPDAEACDYLLFGTVFASESKAPESPNAGVAGLADAVRTSRRPVVAIGGISPDRAAACLDAGAAGVAAIGAFLPPGRARDAMGVREAVAAFRAALAR
jgi:thiamine-phosphate diphosphorylase